MTEPIVLMTLKQWMDKAEDGLLGRPDPWATQNKVRSRWTRLDSGDSFDRRYVDTLRAHELIRLNPQAFEPLLDIARWAEEVRHVAATGTMEIDWSGFGRHYSVPEDMEPFYQVLSHLEKGIPGGKEILALAELYEGPIDFEHWIDPGWL